MLNSHHIASQLAAERQRDLRAAGGGWRLSDLFGRRRAEPAPVAAAQAPHVRSPAGDGGSDAALPTGAGATGQPGPELLVRRGPVGRSASRVSAPRSARDARTPERTGS